MNKRANVLSLLLSSLGFLGNADAVIPPAQPYASRALAAELLESMSEPAEGEGRSTVAMVFRFAARPPIDLPLDAHPCPYHGQCGRHRRSFE